MQGLLKLFGDLEIIETELGDLIERENYTVESKNMLHTIKIKDISSEDLFDVCDIMEKYMFADTDISLEESLVNFLSANDIMMASAESCTGGLISASIINVSGASNVFYEGIVSYNNGSKINRLCVDSELIDDLGAVSAEVAKEMAYGLLSENVQFAISTTGIAGPNGGTEQKPVGLVYIGIAFEDKEPVAIKQKFLGDRETIRQSAKNSALFYALQYLREN